MRKGHEKQHEPTVESRQFVTDLVAAGGLTQHEIAGKLGIVRNTLRKHYADELGRAREAMLELSTERRTLLAAKTLARYEVMLDSQDCAPAVVIFGLKALCGWKETMAIEDVRRDWDDLSDEELSRVVAGRARLRREAAGASGGAQKAHPVRRVHKA